MPIIETKESRAYHFMLIGEQYGGVSRHPQQKQTYALLERLDGFDPTTHIPPEVVGFAYGFSAMDHRPLALIEHEPSFSAQEKSVILMEHQEDIWKQLGVWGVSVLPLKTITLGFRHEGARKYVLFARVGDYPLDGDTRGDLTPVLQRLLQTERDPLKRFDVNPQEFDPELKLGIERGLVSPFMSANLTDTPPIGLLYYRNDSLDGFVAVAVSPYDTLVVDKTVFHLTLQWWQGDFLGVPFRPVIKPVTKAL